MKSKLLIAIFTLLLSGCAVIFPIPHDGALFNNLVETKIAVDKLDCNDKSWINAQLNIERLKVYTALRKDPQADAVVKLQEAINKAKESDNKVFCESILKIQRVRIDVITDAWRGR